MRIPSILFFLFVILSTQVFGQVYTVSEITDEYIEFGSGGGFAPSSKKYILTKSGNLYMFNTQRLISDSIYFQKQICKKQVKKIYAFALKQSIQEYSYNQPGNLYCFIQFHFKNNLNKISWSVPINDLQPDIITLYNKLLKTI
jgi:hypothetical protein